MDSSALIAVLRDEPEAERFTRVILGADSCKVSAANYLETAIVIDSSRDPGSSRRVDQLLTEAWIEIEPVTEKQIRLAREAYRDYGKGSGHPAQLNFGDCFAYALAKDTREPLLFKRTDFAATDVEIAI